MKLITLVLCLICSTTFGQIKLTEQVTKSPETWTGFIKPVINEDGSITSSPGTKPVLAKPSVTTIKYKLETPVVYKFYMLEVTRIPTNEEVQLDKEPDAEVYSFRSGAPTGKYRFKYIGFDPEKGIFKDSIDVTYNPPTPSPGVDPVVPGPVLTGVAEEARLAMLGYVNNMAKDMRTSAAEAKAGKYQNNNDARIRGNAFDLITRTQWKEDIGKIMNSLSDPIKPEEFEAIATGYEAIK